MPLYVRRDHMHALHYPFDFDNRHHFLQKLVTHRYPHEMQWYDHYYRLSMLLHQFQEGAHMTLLILLKTV